MFISLDPRADDAPGVLADSQPESVEDKPFRRTPESIRERIPQND